MYSNCYDSYRPVIIGFVEHQHSSVQLVLKKWIDTQVKSHLGNNEYPQSRVAHLVITNIGEIHCHKGKQNKWSKQIEFSAESNQFEKKINSGNK